MTSTGRHLDETQAGIPNAPSERADLYGQSYCERHQGQLPKGRTQRPDIWAHRSRMRSAKEIALRVSVPKAAMTYFKPKKVGDVRLLLGGLDDDVAVTLTSGVQLPATATPHGMAHKAPARDRATPRHPGEGRVGSRGAPCVTVA